MRPGGNPGRTDQGNPAGNQGGDPGGNPHPHPTKRKSRKGGANMRRNRVDYAVQTLRNELINQGLDPQSAFNFARMALSQKGVTIGRNGKVHYRHALYTAADFANSPLVKYVTGEKAKAANQKALLADPNYQMALSQLGLARDQSQAALDAQRRQATLDFGDPSFVQNDPILAAAVGANQFSTSQALKDSYAQQQRSVTQNANTAGTLFGGGNTSGQQQATHVYAGQQQEATSALQNLMNSLTMQGSQLSQNYNLGQQNALLQTQQNLQEQGLLSKSGPKLKYGKFSLYKPPRQPRRPRAPKPPPRPRMSSGLPSSMAPGSGPIVGV